MSVSKLSITNPVLANLMMILIIIRLAFMPGYLCPGTLFLHLLIYLYRQNHHFLSGASSEECREVGDS